jgi:hypothetical protein
MEDDKSLTLGQISAKGGSDDSIRNFFLSFPPSIPMIRQFASLHASAAHST